MIASFCSLRFTSGVTWNLTSAERFSAAALGGLPPLSRLSILLSAIACTSFLFTYGDLFPGRATERELADGLRGAARPAYPAPPGRGGWVGGGPHGGPRPGPPRAAAGHGEAAAPCGPRADGGARSYMRKGEGRDEGENDNGAAAQGQKAGGEFCHRVRQRTQLENHEGRGGTGARLCGGGAGKRTDDGRRRPALCRPHGQLREEAR